MIAVIEKTNLAYCVDSDGKVQHVREVGDEGLQLTSVKDNHVVVLCGELLTDVKDVLDVKSVSQLHVMREAGAVWEPLCVDCYHDSIEYIYS